MHKRFAFSLIELLIAVAVIGILATLTIINTTRTRTQARDANRKAAVDAYNASLEQWRALSPHKSYFVQILNQPCDASMPSYGYMLGVGDGCVGYGGGGAGRVTRKNIPASGNNRGYAATSVAEALREAGVLNAVRLDPRDVDKEFDDPTATDYILTTCTTDGLAAPNPVQALDFTIYANLELPNESNNWDQNDIVNARRQCAGADSPGPWDTIL